MNHSWKVHLLPLMAGGLTFAAVQGWLLATSNGSGPDPGWFLDEPDAGLAVLTTIALASALVAVFRLTHWLASAAAFTAGAVVAMTIVLFSIGPGTIFPIVIVFGTLVLGMASLIGAVLGWLLRTAWNRVRT